MPTRRSATTPAPERPSDAELLAAITRDLREIYTDIIRQPLPEQLASVLRRLESRAEASLPACEPRLREIA